MKVRGKKKEIIVSVSFLLFICAVFVSSFFISQEGSGMQSVSGKVVSNIDIFTNKLTLLGSLIGLVIVVVTILMIINYIKKTRK